MVQCISPPERRTHSGFSFVHTVRVPGRCPATTQTAGSAPSCTYLRLRSFVPLTNHTLEPLTTISCRFLGAPDHRMGILFRRHRSRARAQVKGSELLQVYSARGGKVTRRRSLSASVSTSSEPRDERPHWEAAYRVSTDASMQVGMLHIIICFIIDLARRIALGVCMQWAVAALCDGR